MMAIARLPSHVLRESRDLIHRARGENILYHAHRSSGRSLEEDSPSEVHVRAGLTYSVHAFADSRFSKTNKTITPVSFGVRQK